MSLTIYEPQTYRLPAELVDRLNAMSEETGVPRVRLVTRALQGFLDTNSPAKDTAAAENAPS